MFECSCSLKLGISHFPSSGEKEVDVLEQKFSSLVNFLTTETEKTYFGRDCPKFHIFPPAVLPDKKLPHGFPSCFSDQTEEKRKWFKDFEAVHSEQVVSQSFISYFSKNDNQEGFLFARDFHTDTFLEAKRNKKLISREKKMPRSMVVTYRVYPCLNLSVA